MLSRRVDPRAGAQRGLGPGRRPGRAANVIPRRRRGRGHRALPGRGRLARRARRWSRRCVRRDRRRRTACRPRSTTPAACRRWSTRRQRRAAARPRPCAPTLGAGRRGRHRAEPRRRGLRLVPRAASPARWPGSASARPGAAPSVDLHQGDFDVDERAIAVGARVLVRGAACVALALGLITGCCDIWCGPVRITAVRSARVPTPGRSTAGSAHGSSLIVSRPHGRRHPLRRVTTLRRRCSPAPSS